MHPPADLPAHKLENIVVAGLHRQGNLVLAARQLGHGGDQLIGHPGWVRGQEPQARQAGHGVDCAQQVGQIGPAGQIVAPRVDDLAQQGDLFRAARHDPPHLIDDLVEWTAALLAAP